MKLRFVAPSSGYYKIRAGSSDPVGLRVYKDRVRLNTRVVGEMVVDQAHEWVGPLQEGDLIEADGETLTLMVHPHDPQEARRPIEAVTLHAAEEVRLADPVGS